MILIPLFFNSLVTGKIYVLCKNIYIHLYINVEATWREMEYSTKGGFLRRRSLNEHYNDDGSLD